MMPVGWIADDHTGAADLASALRRAGLRTVLHLGRTGGPVPDCDAVVVARRIRALPPAGAVAAALDAARWLGPVRLFDKVCSTFDSTDTGNIGPVADALLDAVAATGVGTGPALVCPAAPVHGRTVYMGHLFVGDRLLSESGMRDHPLNPMRDPDLVRVLGRQTALPVGLVPHEVVRRGPGAVAGRLDELARDGTRYAVADAVSDDDLDCLAAAAADLPVLVGAAGLAYAVGRRLRAGAGDAGAVPAPAPVPAGRAVILAGSCAPATLAQVDAARSRFPAYHLDPRPARDPAALAAAATAWLDRTTGATPALLYASAPAADRDPANASAVERAMGEIARHAVAGGVARLLVAGGETSGAVVEALALGPVSLGTEVAPGVPWLVSARRPPLALLLKSGNFGDPDLLVRAAGASATVEVP